jgi:hypothetical protein
VNPKSEDVIMRNGIFGWIAIGTALLLLVPLIAMQFTNEVNWDMRDFIAMGALIFGASSLFVLVSRKVPRSRRLVIGLMFAVVFIYLWAELAVGIFLNLGS